MNFNRKSAFFIILSGFIPGLLFTACTSFFVDPPGDSKITTDDAVLLAEQEIPASGGTLSVQNEGMLEGFKIEVPSGSFNSQKTFKISTAEIISHDMGTYFNPISPLIQIEYEGGYADSLIELTIPIELPPDHYAMGFYYDDKTGVLEGIPVLELTDTYITLATRHFMSGEDLHQASSETKSVNIELDATCNLIVASIAETELYNKPIISTGFSPGIDDYEFTNYGSYIAPGGHCAGQSISMMWYYYEKTLVGEPTLYHRFDLLNNPSKPEFLWMDNPYYFRFASVIQNDIDWSGKLFNLFMKIETTKKDHHISWKAFAMAMLLTGHPQFVGLTSQNGGHAIIAHRMSLQDGILYVTDPNFPGNEREIKYEKGNFKPYGTKQNAHEKDVNAYSGIGYYAVSSMIDWDKVSSRYTEVLDSAIGTIDPNTFPDYTIWAIEKGVDTEITNADEIAFSINSDTLRCIVECPNAEKYWTIDGKRRIDFEVYSETGQQLDVNEGKGKRYVILSPGLNKLGFYILGWRKGHTFSNGNDIDYFIDFKWLNIYASEFSISPDPITGIAGEPIEISVQSDEELPGDALYVWNFGDGSDENSGTNLTSVNHSFETAGSYTVTLEAYTSDEELIGQVSTTATITDNSEIDFNEYPYITVTLQALCKMRFHTNGNDEDSYQNDDVTFHVSNSPAAHPAAVGAELQWDGNQFSASAEFDEMVLETNHHIIIEINGRISEDGTKLEYLYAHKDNNTQWADGITELTIEAFPFTDYYNEDGDPMLLTYYCFGSIAEDYVSDYRYYTEYNEGYNFVEQILFNEDTNPYLYIQFKKE